MDISYDVVVVGGGHAGICAAIAAAENGQRTILIQDRPMLGGNASSECGVPAHGAEALGHNRNLRDTGILEDIRIDFYCRYAKHADITGYWDMLLFDRCRRTENLTLKLNTRMISVKMDGSAIASITVAAINGNSVYEIRGKQFIDATGDGNLGYFAGAEYRVGREAKDEFGELYLGHPQADKHTLGCSIYGWAVKRDYPVEFVPPENIIKYENCSCLSHRHHTADQIFPRVTCSEDQNEIMFFWWLEWGGELDVINDSELIYDHLKAEMFGVWDHLKNHCTDDTVRLLENYELVRWSAFPLKRESRRLIGDYILNETDLVNGRIFEDAIGFGGWPMDDHPPMGIASKEAPCNQLFLSHPYTVPLRSCYSRNVDNLFVVGRCMSVTHAALSSVRVMNTLGSIGEAVGLAASMCCSYNVTPREFCKKHIEELHEKMIGRDLFIPKQNVSESYNQIGCAKLEVSSEAEYSGCSTCIGGLNLDYDIALQLPISSDIIDSLSVCLKSDMETTVSWEIWSGHELEHMDGRLLVEGTVSVKAGSGEYALIKDSLSVAYGTILTVILKANSNVIWLYGDELYNSRWGVHFEGDMHGLAYHGSALVVNGGSPWIWVNGNGRLPGEIATWLEPAKGNKRHSKLLCTPCFTISPSQKPYGAENLGNGKYRSEDWPNIWISAAGMPQSAKCSWDGNGITISRIELIFDTNLDYADQRYGFPRGGDDYSIPAVIKETVSDYMVILRNKDGKGIYSYSVNGNRYRRNIHELLTVINNVCSLEVRVLETNGVAEARIFGIKVYNK